jgi:hypothetical protein
MVMPTIKFTVDASGDNIDAIVEAATKEANDFYKDLPGKFRIKDISVSYDSGYYQALVTAALKEAQERADAWKAEHGDEEDFENLEVVPAHVSRYNGWIEFEYDPNQTKPKKTMSDVMAGHDFDGEAPTPTPNTNRADDPKYQDAF